MSAVARSRAAALAAAFLLSVPPAACARRASTTSGGVDASLTRSLSVRVPAALTLARALDTLSVAVDPASLARTEVETDPGRVVGVEWDAVVFARGQARPDCPPRCARRGVAAATDFDVESTWSTARDGLPVPGVKYVAEVHVVLFETDVPPGPGESSPWDPHVGQYRALWSRTLQQGEE